MANADTGGKPPEISNLQEQFNQQQAQISALKELVRNVDHGKNTASAQEKVKNIAQRLTHLKSKASKSRQSERSYDSEEIETASSSLSQRNELECSLSYETPDEKLKSVPSTPVLRAKSETPGSEKIQLLRLQIEQNRQKMAEREHSKRGIEEMVTQLKAKFDITQMSLEKSSELGKSIGDLSLISGKGSLTKSTQDLTISTTNLDKERIRNLQRKIIDLEQRIKDKEILTDNETEQIKKIQKLEHKILDLEENLREKECIIEARTQAVSLMSENLSLKGKNTVELLEETKQEMFKMQNNFIQSENEYKSDIEILKIELDEKCSIVENLHEKIKILENSRFELTMKNSELEKKLEDVQEYSSKLSELNKLNENLQRRVNDLENQKYDVITDDEVADAKNADSDDKIQILMLQNENKELIQKLELYSFPDDDIQDRIKKLTNELDKCNIENEELKQKVISLEEFITEKNIEYNVLSANFSVLEEKLNHTAPKSLFSKSTDDESDVEIAKLKTQLDETNKSSIKMKLKIKQLQKQIDNFKKSSNIHQDVVKLTDENQILQQKIVELEEEKGQLQLKLVCEDKSVEAFSDVELENKIKILEHTCQNQTSAIQLLEEQKMDMSLDLNSTKLELITLKDQVKEFDQQETSRVTSHYNEIEYEEKMEIYKFKLIEMEKLNNNYKTEIEKLIEEKNRYFSENIELLDRIDKLNIEKGSSNESIEIVENLTQQEKQEIEEYQKLREKSKSAETPKKQININEHENLELSDSLIKLREESSELMNKIDLFTAERCEVLEKLEILTSENNNLKETIVMLQNEKLEIEEKIKKKTDVVVDFNEEIYLKSLKNIENEIESLRKNKDKNFKSKVKKLLAEAQKIHDLLKGLLEKYQENLKQTAMIKSKYDDIHSKFNTLRQVRECESKEEIDRLKILLQDSINSDTYSLEINNKEQKIDELKSVVNNLQTEIERLKHDTQLTQESLEHELNLSKAQLNENQTLVDNIKSDFNTLHERDRQLMIAKENQLKHDCELLQQELKNIKDRFNDSEKLLRDLNDREKQYEDRLQLIKEKNDEFNNEILLKKSEIDRLKTEIKDSENKHKAYEDQIKILKSLVSEQKEQLINIYTEHECEIEEKIKIIDNYEKQLDKLNVKLNEQSQSGDVTENLRSMLDKQEEELHYKQETIDSLNNQIIELYKTMEENRSQMIIRQDELDGELALKSHEILSLTKNLSDNKTIIDKLKKDLHDKITEIQTVQKSTSANNKIHELENKISGLESKNRELMDKLKKFAANFKKKVAQCNELEEKLTHSENSAQSLIEINELKNERDTLIHKLNQQIQFSNELQNQVFILNEDINHLKLDLSQTSNNLQQSNISIAQNLNDDLEKLQNNVENQNKFIKDLNRTIVELNTTIEYQKAEIIRRDRALDLCEAQQEKHNIDLKDQEEKNLVLNEKLKHMQVISEESKGKSFKIEKCKAIIKEKNKEIQRLNNNCDELKVQMETLNQKIIFLEDKTQDHSDKSIIQRLNAKAEENLLYTETLETENAELKDKIAKLEDGVRSIEESRMNLERQASLLDNELHEKTMEFSQNEDLLVQRLTSLSQHDEIMETRLKEVQNENMELGDMLKEMKFEKDELNKKLQNVQNHLNFLEETKLMELEKDNLNLNQRIEKQQIELKRIHNDFEKKLFDKNSEFDDMEANYTETMQSLEKHKKEIEETLEKSRDECTELKDEIVRVKENLHNLEQTKTDLERELTWIKLQNENLAHDQIELQELRMQLIQDQTEIENLRQQNQNILSNHEIEINHLKTQLADLDSMNLQVGQNQTDDQVMLQHENKKLRELIVEKETEIEKLQQSQGRAEPSNQVSLSELQSIINDKQNEIIKLQNELKEVRSNLLRQVSQPEVDCIVEYAQQALQNSPALQHINFEEIANVRHKYEQDIKIQHQQIETLTNELQILRSQIADFEQKYQKVHILREESLNQLAAKTKLTDKLHQEIKSKEIKIIDLENQLSDKNKTIPITETASSADPVISFNSSMFFGNPTEPSPFDETLPVPKVQLLQSQPPNEHDLNIFNKDYENDLNEIRINLERITIERDNLLLEMNGLKTLNENNLLKLNQLYNTQAECDEFRLHNDKISCEINDLRNFNNELQLKHQSLLTEKENLLHDYTKVRDLFEINEKKIVDLSCTQDCFEQLSKLLGTEDIFNKIQQINNERDNLFKELEEFREINSNINSKLQNITSERDDILKEFNALQVSPQNILPTVKTTKAFDDKTDNSNNQLFSTAAKFFEASSDVLFDIPISEDIFRNKTPIVEDEIIPQKKIIGPNQTISPGNNYLPMAIGSLSEDESNIWNCEKNSISFKKTTNDIDTNTEIDYESVIQQLENKNRELQTTIDCMKMKLEEISSIKEDISKQFSNQNIIVEDLKQENMEYQIKLTQLEDLFQSQSSKMSLLSFKESNTFVDDQPHENIPSFNSSAFFQMSSNDFLPFDQHIEHHEPIIEEIIVPKKGYICGLEEQQPEEEWAWGSGDAILEEQHQKATITKPEAIKVPPSIQSQIEIQEYQDKIQELELQRSRLEEEVVALKVKSGKLIKKLKEYKSERDFKKSPSVESSSDLDLAIQEELKNQVSTLENKLKAIKIDADKYNIEREGFLKRIDVLTAANDRMTEMKDRQDKDIEMYVYKIKELNSKLLQLEEWGDDSNYNKETPVKQQPIESQMNSVHEEKISSLLLEVNDLKIDNEELQAILDEEKGNNKINDAKIFQLQQQISDFKHRIGNLEEELRKSTQKIDEKIGENNELRNEIERMKTASLFQAPEFFTSSQSNPFSVTSKDNLEKINELENEIQSLTGQLQYKNSEILQLNQKINEIIKEDQTESLVQEILHKNQEIQLLKHEVENLNNDKEELENNLSLQITQEEIVTLKKEAEMKNQKIISLESEKSNMEQELKILNDQVLSSLELEDQIKTTVLELDVKNIEIGELKKTIESMRQQIDTGGTLQINEDPQKVDERLYELENRWKQYVMEREMQFNSLIESLNTEIAELKFKINNTNQTNVDSNPGVSKQMQEALENQELEIVTLKEQLAIRSAEYARLAAQLDPFAQFSTSSNTSSIKLPKQNIERQLENNDSTEHVPRAELDLTLYMLHQRDMRCEELTLELVHLLEERDTLQLKLSNAIRQIEEIKKKAGIESDEFEISDIKSNTTDKIDNSSDFNRAERPPTVESPELKTKLTELRGVNQTRDKTLQEDRENRQRQMNLLQKDISNIPSEAVAHLVGTDYTLSRTSQSPSTVLLNWLMGKSTPREPQT